MRKRYSTAQLNFLRSGYQAMRIHELTAAFNSEFGLSKTKGQINSTLQNHRITCGRVGGNQKGTYLLFDKAQVQFIKTQYHSLSSADLAVALNNHFGTKITQSQIVSFVHNHGIESGRTGCFEKGNKPWNTGTKGLLHGSCTSFKKGSVPKNLKPIGYERICSKDGYILIKVDETNPHTGFAGRFRAKQIVVWERHRGPVPKGMIIRFIDGNRLNCDPDNLECISKREHLYLNRNGYDQLPAELKPAMRTLAQLEMKQFDLLRAN